MRGHGILFEFRIGVVQSSAHCNTMHDPKVQSCAAQCCELRTPLHNTFPQLIPFVLESLHLIINQGICNGRCKVSFDDMNHSFFVSFTVYEKIFRNYAIQISAMVSFSVQQNKGRIWFFFFLLCGQNGNNCIDRKHRYS